MPAYKKSANNWYVSKRYVDWNGKPQRFYKSGFKTKKEALKAEAKFMSQIKGSMKMPFGDFLEMYYEDLQNRVREHTLMTKHTVIDKLIKPYFEKIKMEDITVNDVRKWQNELLAYRDKNGNGYKPTYLKTIHNQLSAIFNHAVKYYGLANNPAQIAGNMGKETTKEMKIWTKEEYLAFSKALMRKDGIYQAFEMLYWCGLRMGEMLALTPADFDFERGTVNINKSYQRLKKRDVITDPKTVESFRTVQMPDFLREEIKDYVERLYIPEDARMFVFSKSGLHHEMDRGCNESGVKRIRIHDLRHSHVSLLIEQGFNAVDIAKRVGHKSITITYRYAHLFPNKDKKIANHLNETRGNMFGDNNVCKE